MLKDNKVTSSEVEEKLTVGQIEKIWQQVDAKKEHDPNPLKVQVFWLAGVEVWVVEEDGIATMMFPNEEA